MSKSSPTAALNRIPRSRAPLAWVGWLSMGALAFFVLYTLGKNLISNPPLFVQNVIDGLKLGFVYALIALGYTMVYGIVRLINFAHGDVFMVGAFTSYYAVTRFNLHRWPELLIPGFPVGLSMVLGSATVILLSMIVCLIMAVTIERVAYKPLRDAPRIAALITAIGVSFFLEYFGALYFVYSPRFIPYKAPFPVVAWFVQNGIHPIVPGVEVAANAVTFSNIVLIIMAASILVQVLLSFIVRRTKMGVAMRATSFDKPTARLMGINVDKVISFTFAIGAAFAGLGGVLYAIAYSSIYTLLGIMPGLKAFVAAVLGGIGSISGAAIGGFTIGILQSVGPSLLLTGVNVPSPFQLKDVVTFVILILVLLFRPGGILGTGEAEKV